MTNQRRFFFGVHAENGRTYGTSASHAFERRSGVESNPRKLPFEVESSKLSSSGWGLLHPRNIDHSVLDALEPLLAHRHAEAGRLFKMEALQGDSVQQSASRWLSERTSSQSLVDPEATPYHLLILGGPSEIPLAFDLELGQDFSVGRLYFEHPKEYRRYAETVVDIEKNGIDRKPKLCLFGPSNSDDPATTFSHDQLMAPLKDDLTYFLQRRGFAWSLEGLLGVDATKEHLSASLFHEQSPTVLMATCQSLVSANLAASANLGAVICQNWPGPIEAENRSLHPSQFFCHQDLGPTTNVRGLIGILLGSFSAGVSNTEDSALSLLPTRLLSHENGSALAIIGSLASSSMSPDDETDLRRVYGHFLRRIALGSRTGSCLQELKSSLRPPPFASQDDRRRTKSLRRTHKSLMLLGDPAVRSAISDPKLYSRMYTGF